MKTLKFILAFATLALSSAAGCRVALAQQAQKVLTNADVIKMVKAGLDESVVVAAIESSPGKYDISPDGLIALHQAGVTQNETNAILAAEKSASSAAAAGAVPAVTTGGNSGTNAASKSKWQMPTVVVLGSGGSQELPRERTHLAETRMKPRSLAGLASDSAVTQGMQAGVSDAAWDTATHMHSALGGNAVLQASGIFGGMLGRGRQPMVTYVWGVSGPASANVLQTTMPKFAVNFANAPGVKAREFVPEIIKLTPTQDNSCRLVGATTGRDDAQSRDAVDWEIYSNFVEDPVPVSLQNTQAGEYQVSLKSALEPGEYAVVLRPVSRTEKFSGGDVARAQGPGLLFDTVWSFEVSENAQ